MTLKEGNIYRIIDENGDDQGICTYLSVGFAPKIRQNYKEIYIWDLAYHILRSDSQLDYLSVLGFSLAPLNENDL